MFYEEGVRGLWRAFPLHAVTQVARLGIANIILKNFVDKQVEG